MFTYSDILDRLCQVEVKGRNNLENLLWCIMAMEAIIEAEKNDEKTADVVETDEDGEIDG